MQPPRGVKAPFVMPKHLMPIDFHVNAVVGHRPIGSATVTRRPVARTVIRTAVRDSSVVGVRFTPAGSGLHAGVIVLGGSEGGVDERTAALLASHGFATLALAYFGAPGLPPSLVHVPVETVQRALRYLGRQPGVDSTRLALLGTSRGGELALLAGSLFSDVHAVVGIVPSAVVGAGLAFGAGPVPESPWTYHGRPVPFMRFADWMDFTRSGRGWDRIAPAVIPVERIHGPVLLVSADDDQLGFSSPLSRIGFDRLRRARRPFRDVWLHYPDAGHLIDVPYLPTANLAQLDTPYGVLHFGGTPAGYAHADADSWPRIVGFLAAALRQHRDSLETALRRSPSFFRRPVGLDNSTTV